jgi:protein pelota
MKLLRTSRTDDLGEDTRTLLPEEPEDMVPTTDSPIMLFHTANQTCAKWHAYNLIGAGDIVRAHAIRKVVTETQTGGTFSERVHTNLTIEVKSTFFDPVVSQLKVTGKVITENSFVNMGQFHTLDLALNRNFTISKPHGWDSVAIETLQEALADDKNGAVAAVVMQDGISNICLITSFRTVLKQRVESAIPKKRSAANEQDEGRRRFYDKTLSALLRTVDFDQPRPLLLASPGFIAAEFKTFIATRGRDKLDKKLTNIAADATVIHTNSGHVHSLNEVLKSPEVLSKMKDMKFARETAYIDRFFEKLRADDGRAWYGIAAVEKAVTEGAVGQGGGVLLINNSLFRSDEIATRKRFVALVDKVRANGGEARVLSSDHESGQRLDMLGGIAAILTYPMPDLDEEDEHDADVAAGDAEISGSIV